LYSTVIKTEAINQRSEIDIIETFIDRSSNFKCEIEGLWL